MAPGCRQSTATTCSSRRRRSAASPLPAGSPAPQSTMSRPSSSDWRSRFAGPSRARSWRRCQEARCERAGRTLSAHVDTLGAMVKEIKDDGRLKLTRIGGYDWATIEGEYCTVHAAGGTREVTGTIVTTKASAHVLGAELRELRRMRPR